MTIKLIKTQAFVISPHSVGCLDHLLLSGSADVRNLPAAQLLLFVLREPQLRLALSAPPGLSSSSGLPHSWSHGSSVPREQECCCCKASWNLHLKLTSSLILLVRDSYRPATSQGMERWIFPFVGWRCKEFWSLLSIYHNCKLCVYRNCITLCTLVSSLTHNNLSVCVMNN